MPLPNFHACRVQNPSLFDKIRYAKDDREHRGKKYDVLYGRRKDSDKWEDQAYRYSKRIWTARQARDHCRSHRGKFEAASGRELRHAATVVQPMPPWSSIRTDRLPVMAFAGEVASKPLYPHHWVRNGHLCEVAGRYVSGEMFVHTAGLIEALRKAKEDKAPAALVEHLENDRKVAGVRIKKPGEPAPTDPPARTEPPATTEPPAGQGNELIIPALRLPEFKEGSLDFDHVNAEIIGDQVRQAGDIEDWQMEAINRLAQEELKRKGIFVFPMWISNDKPDSFSTRMDAGTTLENFRQDLIDSRSLLKNHDISVQIGASFHGEKGTRDGHDGTWVKGWYYILRAVALGEGSLGTDDIIKQIMGGVYRRGSVRFTLRDPRRARGYYQCEICGNNFTSADCSHLPGVEYEGRICILRVMNGSMNESSLAFMNSAQGTVIEKAQRMAKDGSIRLRDALELEMLYGARFTDIKTPVSAAAPPSGGSPDPGRTAVGGDTPPGGEPPGTRSQTRKKEKKTMDLARTLLKELASQLRTALPKGKAKRVAGEFLSDIEGAEGEPEARTALDTLTEAVTGQITDMQGRLETAEPIVALLPDDQRTTEAMTAILARAKEGEDYRKRVVDTALEEAVRYEKDIDQEHWRKVFGGQDIAFVEKQGSDWKAMADTRVKAGQKTNEGDDKAPEAGKGKTADEGDRPRHDARFYSTEPKKQPEK